MPKNSMTLEASVKLQKPKGAACTLNLGNKGPVVNPVKKVVNPPSRWEKNNLLQVQRLAVPGGWIVKTALDGSVFMPDARWDWDWDFDPRPNRSPTS